MSLEDELYNELLTLREDLRNRTTYSNGRKPEVCSDAALMEMSQRIPTKLEDFTAISGVGSRFVEQYGPEFLAVTKKYAVTAAKCSSIDKHPAQTLRELQTKLVNISKANRLLFQPKTGKKTAFDPTSVRGADVLGLIFGRKRVITVCDTSKSKEDEKVYRRVNEIIREVSRDQREKGAFDLYIAYPFVEGKLAGEEDFPVRAPLALFPVTMEKEGTAIKVRMDDSRDAVYNNTFILAAMKISGRNRPLPDNVIETYDDKTFITELAQFYAEQGLELELPTRKTLTAFTEYKTSEFPRYAPGELHLVQNAVIGKYPSYSSFIQRDFDTLLSGREINNTLSDLIKDLNREDFYSEYPLPLSTSELRSKGLEASEKDLYYINSLNSAQENILTAINKSDEIVVQGPPGTGKSQVITGLISAAVASGKTVLMVSEKKTALDVVYSRLGNLSKFCLQIDDTADKDSFYRQLGTMLSIQPVANNVDLSEISSVIDRDVGKLTDIATELYGDNGFGLPACNLYAMDRWLDLNDRVQYETYKRYKEGVAPSILSVKYPELRELHTKFANPSILNNIREYNDILEKSSLIKLMKPNLSEYQLSEMRADLERLEGEVRDLNSKGFLAKLFSKGKVGRDATDLVNKYFTSYNSRTVDEVMSAPLSLLETVDDYDVFAARSSAYNSLTGIERDYGNSLLGLSKSLKCSAGTTNDEIFKFVLDDHLQRFDGNHKQILQELHDFDTIVADIDRNMAQKRDMTKRLMESILSNDLRYITESKRRGDIARIVDNKRKWSLNKFINRYGYELFKGVRIWLLTPEVVSDIIPMEMGLFDLLIFDEASQMYVEKGIPSIYRAKKVVVAGDHKQLRPSSLGTGRVSYEEDEDDEEEVINGALEEESLLDLARARYDSILLNFHYRSRYEELIAFSNYAFYGGKLYVSPNINQPERPPIEVYKVDGLWQDRQNLAEADKVVEILREIFTTRQNRETVGIITFNVSQRDLINDRIDDYAATDPAFAAVLAQESKRFDNGEDVGLFVKNIESVQGDERDIIIFSIGYAKNEDGKFMQRFGWLNTRGGENRLNVAISRAKKKIHIVNSFEPEELQVDNLKSEGPKILKKYLQYAKAVSDGNTPLAQTLLQGFVPPSEREYDPMETDLPVINRVYNALVRKGYTVERNIGIGGYTIDLAVKQDNRFILGIECDSRIYSMSNNTRERDYHRQKYLESRGWHIHRIWTPGMYKDADAEIAKIVSAIERSLSSS
ncbi:MAG: AAA domain-containing protein [archaeon]|nr:AAA domain-containing protein [archaeon]